MNNKLPFPLDFDDTKQKRAGGGSVGLFPFPRFELRTSHFTVITFVVSLFAESAEAIQTWFPNGTRQSLTTITMVSKIIKIISVQLIKFNSQNWVVARWSDKASSLSRVSADPVDLILDFIASRWLNTTSAECRVPVQRRRTCGSARDSVNGLTIKVNSFKDVWDFWCLMMCHEQESSNYVVFAFEDFFMVFCWFFLFPHGLMRSEERNVEKH